MVVTRCSPTRRPPDGYHQSITVLLCPDNHDIRARYLGGDATMDTSCPKCGRPAEITWSGSVRGTERRSTRLAVRCVDLHWSVVEDAAPASLSWGTIRHRARSIGTPRSA
jgi:hypothetical protein